MVEACRIMCPQQETAQRTADKDISVFKTNDKTKNWRHGRTIDPTRAVKKFHRLTGTHHQARPEDVHPPAVIMQSMQHLLTICDAKFSFDQVYHFVRDRTRSVRQELNVEGMKGEECMTVHGHIARFHIMSWHRTCKLTHIEHGCSAKQNVEDMEKCLTSLWRYEVEEEVIRPWKKRRVERQARFSDKSGDKTRELAEWAESMKNTFSAIDASATSNAAGCAFGTTEAGLSSVRLSAFAQTNIPDPSLSPTWFACRVGRKRLGSSEPLEPCKKQRLDRISTN